MEEAKSNPLLAPFVQFDVQGDDEGVNDED